MRSTKRPANGRRKPVRAPIRQPGPGLPTDGLLRFLGVLPKRRRPLHSRRRP
jgi:hypothetical protein